MESDPEFQIHSFFRFPARTLTEYRRVQRKFIPADGDEYTKDSRNIRIRKYGLRIISNYSKNERRLNAFIPYIAMNYFDRFMSRHPLPEKESDDKENVRLLAVCCLTISWKMWTKSFSVQEFLSDHSVGFSILKIREMEFCILNGLRWRMRSITPFHFLSFYYPQFKEFGGFKRRCLHEVIVHSLCDPAITLHPPRVVGYASLAAAADVAYGEAAKNIPILNDGESSCRSKVLQVIKNKKIQIEKGETEKEKQSLVMARKAVSSEDIASSSNKGINLRTTMSDSAIDIPAERESPKKMWDFELKWLTEEEEREIIHIPRWGDIDLFLMGINQRCRAEPNTTGGCNIL